MGPSYHRDPDRLGEPFEEGGGLLVDQKFTKTFPQKNDIILA
jgi:hypothetical protein